MPTTCPIYWMDDNHPKFWTIEAREILLTSTFIPSIQNLICESERSSGKGTT